MRKLSFFTATRPASWHRNCRAQCPGIAPAYSAVENRSYKRVALLESQQRLPHLEHIAAPHRGRPGDELPAQVGAVRAAGVLDSHLVAIVADARVAARGRPIAEQQHGA